MCTTHGLIYKSSYVGNSWSTWATLTGLADPMSTRGDLIVRDAANATARLGIGAAGKVLSSDGTDILWQYPGHVLLEQHTASNSATLDFTTFISSAYDQYQFEFLNLVPATDVVDLGWRAGTGGGPTYDTTSGHYGHTNGYSYTNTGGGEGTITAQTYGKIAQNLNNTAASFMGACGHMRLYDPSGSAVNKVLHGQIVANQNGIGIIQRSVASIFIQSTAITAVRFLMSSGNITSGTIRVYGIAK